MSLVAANMMLWFEEKERERENKQNMMMTCPSWSEFGINKPPLSLSLRDSLRDL